MKKFAKGIELTGALLFFLGISADATVNPMVAIPVLSGLLMICIGCKLDGDWQEVEEIVEDHVFIVDEEADDGIVYICDSSEDKEKLPYYKEVMKKKRNHPNRPKLNDSQSKQ